MTATTTQTDVLDALRDFRSGVAADLTMMTANQESHSDRAAAQDGLQLIWSFVVADFTVTDADEQLLRKAFPDELFGADPDTKFRELRDSVEDAYADAWKLTASDHLCSLVTACATAGTLEPVGRYRERALNLAALTVDLDRPVSGKAVADVGRFDAMLRQMMILTEVAIMQSTIPDQEQVKKFSGKVPQESAIAFDFIGLLEDEMGVRFVRAFAEQYGSDTAFDLLEDQLIEDQTELAARRIRGALASLEET
ncbi:MAG: hypothetical protein WBF71_04320 [Microthrixaceae bacterium]